jgi:peptide deformylase
MERRAGQVTSFRSAGHASQEALVSRRAIRRLGPSLPVLTLSNMALLPILEFPDPRLRTRAEPVAQVDSALRRLIDDMFETMYAAPGIGLAATQVNVHKRLLVIDVSEKRNERLALINPEILNREGVEETEEGCLSVPGIYDKVTRANRIRVRALDRDGKQIEFDADGLLAVCIQHEIDHLDGKLFVDYLSDLKRTRIRKKLEKDRKDRAASGSGTKSRPKAL